MAATPCAAVATADIAQGVKQKMVSLCRRPAHTAAAASALPLHEPPCGSASLPTAAPEPIAPQAPIAAQEPIAAQGPTAAQEPPANRPGSPKTTFYRRSLPAHLVSFTSTDGRQLFKEALNDGFAEGYFNLAGNFTVQSEPAYCGPSSLAMVLNALEVDPGRRWKGVWRWYSDELLESCRPAADVKANGITFDQFLCLASAHAHVVVKRGAQASRAEFLRDIQYVTRRDDVFMVLSFARGVLGQTGDGHFSPVGAYHPRTNRALVLDSARYKYPSWFADVDLLYDALQPADPETGRPRGYFLVSRRDPLHAPAPGQQLPGACPVDLPERPADVFPTRLSCGGSQPAACCSSGKPAK